MARALGIELFEELPATEREYTGGGGRESETANLVKEIMQYVADGSVKAAQPVRIAVYDKPGGAAGCAGQLKRRFGKPEAYGVKVHTRKTKADDGTIEGYSVFVMYDPSWVVAGEQEKQDAEFAAYQTKLRDAARERAANKAAGIETEPKKRGRSKKEDTEEAAA